MPMLRLTVYRGDEEVADHRFERDIIKIGRLASAHLKLDDERVSRIHAVVESTNSGKGFAIIDMGSTVGTFINGKKVSKEKLAHGDEIIVGEHRIVVDTGGAAKVAAPVTGDMHSGDIVASVPAEPRPASIDLPTPGLASNGAEALPSMPPPGPASIPPVPVAASAPVGFAAPQGSGAYPVAPAPGGYPPPSVPGAGDPYAAPMPPTVPEGAPPWSDTAYGAYAPTAAPAFTSGYHPGWAPPPSVPNNLASAGVPDDERALEVKLIWGNSVLDTVTLTEQSELTLGDERKVSGFGPFQKVVRCDVEVPSQGLPSKTHVLAERQGSEGTTYLLNLPAGLVGRVERADGTLVTLDLIYEGQHGGQSDGMGGARYLLQPEETVYLGYGHLILQLRYVRRTQTPLVLPFSRMDYVWANTLILALFFHVMTIGSFLATPELSVDLTDELFKNRNRFIQTRLKEAEKQKRSGGLLDELKGPGEKAKKKEGKAGRRDTKKTDGKLASKGKPDQKEKARKALDNLLGLGGKGKAAGIFSGRSIGGDLMSAMGNLQGRRTGDALGLGGLGTRGTGAGGGGLSYDNTGLGDLGTAGRGGGKGGTRYGDGQSSLGGKKERDVEITAGAAIVRGSLSKEIIRRVIQKHQAQIRYCYEKELQRSPGLYGKVATEFVIDAAGFVKVASVYQTTMKNKEVERCITSKIRTWRFPKPKGGGIVVVKYPFLFKASG